jgi:FKBP-type peptidyl-prolyl cis-trans isomerase
MKAAHGRIYNTSLLLFLFLLCPAIVQAAGSFQSTARGAQYQDLKAGEGKMAKPGDVATIHFISWLDSNGAKGKEIYNTHKEGKTVSFVVGTDKVMPGWNEGVIGMKQGGKRLLKLPPALGYGGKGVQGIVPPNARLILIIDLVQLE